MTYLRRSLLLATSVALAVVLGAACEGTVALEASGTTGAVGYTTAP
jgi:hypothetical protein